MLRKVLFTSKCLAGAFCSSARAVKHSAKLSSAANSRYRTCQYISVVVTSSSSGQSFSFDRQECSAQSSRRFGHNAMSIQCEDNQCHKKRRELSSRPFEPVPSLLLQSEDFQHAGIFWHALPRFAEPVAVAITYQRAPSSHDGNVLLALGQIRDDAAVVPLAIVMFPELLATGCVIGSEGSIGFRNEQHVSTRAQQAGMRSCADVRNFKLHLSADRIASADVAAHRFFALGRYEREVCTDVQLHHRLRDGFGFHYREVDTPFVAHAVEQAGLRIVGSRIPAVSARNRRAEIFVLAFRVVLTSDQRAVGLDVFHKRDGINALV